MQESSPSNKKTIYESIYGGKGYSIAGPIFYLILGIFCLIIVIFLSITGGYFPDTLENVDLLRPDISFPFLGILFFLCLPGSIVGLVFGLSGLFWRYYKK
ncbi:MAG: hypothetical protein ACXAC6_07700 [Candidatus Hodarchaeales archaeon]|jgi:hypothetical protein